MTVFDIDGFLSSPQSILVSTTSDTTLGAGISTVLFQQRFGYVTLRSESSNQWSVVNESAFPIAGQAYSMNGIQFTTLNVTNTLGVVSSITVPSVHTKNLIVTSSASVVAPLYTSSIVMNNYPTYLAMTNYPYFQTGSESNTGNIIVQSTFSVSQQAVLLSTVSTIGPLFVQGDMNILGSYSGSNAITIQSSFSTTQRILVNSNITVTGLVQIGSNVTCARTLNTSSMTTNQAQATSITANGFLFSAGSLLPLTGPGSPALLIQPSLLLPTSFIQTSTLNTSELSTGSIVVGSTIDATRIPILSVQAVPLQNPRGSLTVSSIATGNVAHSTLYGFNYTSTIATISTNTSFFSTLHSANSLYVKTGTSTIATIADSCIANSIVVGVLDLVGVIPLQMNNFSISSIYVSTAFLANQMSSFTTYSTLFDATGATFQTSQILTGPVATSTLQLLEGIGATNSLLISTASVSLSTANIQAASTQTITTSSLYTMGASVGALLTYSTTSLGAPYMYGSTVSGLSSDTSSEYIAGIGTPFSPFHVLATQDRTVNGFLQNPSGNPSTYMNLSYIYRTDSANPAGSATILMGNSTVQSTIITISSSSTVPYQHFSLQNYAVDLSSIQFVQLIHSDSGAGQQTSDLSVWLANVSTPAGNYVNSNSGIEMNSGFMRWNNRQYGLTIQNQYNDLQTRTMTYTGSLFTASDSNLKHEIEYADSEKLYQSIRDIPLNRYALSDKFRTTFRTQDAHQLGVLTTNVAKEFPALIHPVDSEHLGLSNLETVDRVQFRYAHLGATQHLMGRVSTLKGTIEERLRR